VLITMSWYKLSSANTNRGTKMGREGGELVRINGARREGGKGSRGVMTLSRGWKIFSARGINWNSVGYLGTHTGGRVKRTKTTGLVGKGKRKSEGILPT